MIGQKIAHYEVTAKLGAGGMGEVYRARDTNLERDVALKILPEALIGDADRLARFEREARTLAGLNHPNIAQVYGLEGDGATRAIVMELVDGRDLAEVLGKARLPLEDALPIARQIAEALDAAHEQGVIHRDLKPANVMLTAVEQVKVLDFGLAKSTDGAAVRSSSGDPVDSRTMTTAPTQAGVILGTAAYMSPEQARGKLLDKRSDIWSFGCVLYEMLTGRCAFDGETMTDVLAAIVRAEPDWAPLERVAPPRLVRLVQRCLRKDHKERLRDIGEAALTLREIAAGDDGRPAVAQAHDPADSAPGAGPWKMIAGIAGIAALALAALQFGPWKNDSASTGSGATAVTAMSLLTDFAGSQRSPSLSPDGKQLLYVAEDGGDLDIFLLRVGGQNAVNLTADFDSDDDHPAWSPDGERIAFDSDRDGGGIFVMGATGESARRVSEEGFHPGWSPDGKQLTFCDENIFDVYSRTSKSPLHIVDVETGARSVIPVSEDAAQGQWSPDGRWIAYWTARTGQRDIRVISASGSGEFIPITDDTATDWEPRWAPDGKAIYFVSDRGGSPDLWKIAVNPATGQPIGAPQAVTTGVARVASFSMDKTGERIMLGVSNRIESFERIPFDPGTERPRGPAEPIFSSKNHIAQFSLSRDEQRIAYRAGALQEDLYTIRVDGTDRRRLTNDRARDRGPDWSPDDEWIVFYSNRGGDYEHWLIGADGTGLRVIATESTRGINDPSWSNDGKRISATGTSSGSAIYDVDPAWFEPDAGFEPHQISRDQVDFIALGWSTDDQHLSGCTDWDGEFATYALTSGAITRLRYENGESIACRGTALLDGWLDASRLIFWDASNHRAVLWDLDDEQLREVPGIPGPSKFEIADGGRTLFIVRAIQDAEIWMLELGSEGP